jgi:uncharacterized membrane protein
MRALLCLALAACVDTPLEIDDLPCPDTGTTLTYDTFGRTFMANHCDRCHTDARSGAPTSIKLHTHDDVKRHAARVFVRAAGPNVTMPPGPSDPPAAERDQLAEWLACGAP